MGQGGPNFLAEPYDQASCHHDDGMPQGELSSQWLFAVRIPMITDIHRFQII